MPERPVVAECWTCQVWYLADGLLCPCPLGRRIGFRHRRSQVHKAYIKGKRSPAELDALSLAYHIESGHDVRPVEAREEGGK